jgi:WD40 repeat protein
LEDFCDAQCEGPVAVACSPDGHTLASASYDHTVKLWSLDDGARPRAVLRSKSFESKSGSHCTNSVFKRVKEK